MSETVQLSTAPRKGHAPVSDDAAAAVRADGVYVVFTTLEDTVTAARVAAAFAGAMAVPLTVVPFRAVPFPLSVDAPVGISPVETDWFVARLKAEGVDVHLRVVLCRQAPRLLALAFKPHSLVVMRGGGVGGRRGPSGGDAPRDGRPSGGVRR